MNALIVYSHPSKKSFTYQVFRNIVKGLEYSGHSTLVSDLYEVDFQTDMTEDEYKREGFARIERPLPDDIVAEHQKIQPSA